MNSTIPSIDEIYIDKLRNLNNFHLDFHPKLNILIGPNGVGKTTVLEVINKIYNERYWNFDNLTQRSNAFVGVKFNKINITSRLINKYKFKIIHSKHKLLDGMSEFEAIRRFYTSKRKYFEIVDSGINPNIFKNKKVTFISTAFRKPGNIEAIAWESTGFIVHDSTLYETQQLGFREIQEFTVGECLSFNPEANRRQLQEMTEEKRRMKDHFKRVVEKSSTHLNKLVSSSTQQFAYTSQPKMNMDVFSSEGVNIKQLSSGQRRLEELTLFNSLREQIIPKVVTIDEPELHLNYGQLPHIGESLKTMVKNKSQVFIATHSSYFIRSQHYNNMKYLAYDSKNNPTTVNLDQQNKPYYIAYPQIFFAKNVILVEGYPDKIFLERSLELLLRGKGFPDLSATNTAIIAIGGKDKFNKVVNFIKTNTNLKVIIICDLDLVLKKKDYKFIGVSNTRKVEDLTKDLLLGDIFRDAKIFRKFSETQAVELIEFLDETFKAKYIPKSSQTRYENYRSLFKSLRTEGNPEIALKKQRKLKSIHEIFVENDIWLLKQGKIDSYVKSELKHSGKLSESKLQERFYPNDKKELVEFLAKNSADELTNIVDFISTRFA